MKRAAIFRSWSDSYFVNNLTRSHTVSMVNQEHVFTFNVKETVNKDIFMFHSNTFQDSTKLAFREALKRAAKYKYRSWPGILFRVNSN